MSGARSARGIRPVGGRCLSMTDSPHPDLLVAPDETRRCVEELVDNFRRNRDQYRAQGYNETQLRLQFLNPFFEALGWDVTNRQGYAEAYKDVIHEATVNVEGKKKAPDYSFRIGGQRKFYLEAKKPAVNVHDDPGPAYQLRRYAWSAKLPLSLLTDFEEFAVYDCRQKPAPTDPPGLGRILFFTFEQYLDHLDELYSLFSREGILRGSFDRFAQDKRKHRGTQEVDAAFLEEIEKWRESLAKDLARHNHLSVPELNYAVQTLIDRILFLRIAEDRGVEHEDRLRELGEKPGIYPGLCDLFSEADEKYNAGLFDFSPAGDTLCPGLTLSDKTLKPILSHLYYPDCPYEFSVLGADILGAVYEQFLGKVIRLTPAGYAKVEEKPEVKKAGGVYYTPTYIVDYIVEHTVGEALAEAATPEKAAKLRLLDPACGSGSFLLGAYQFLLDWHLKYYLAHDPQKLARKRRPPVVRLGQDDWRLTISERKRILLNNLYGVDLDRQAVEVTKLNLLLKCLEGVTEQTADQTLRLLHERLLPNIDANIKCGNSLIGSDYFTGRLAIDEEEQRRVNPFDWERGFPEIMKAGGFDCVIGNPPYGAFFGEVEKGYFGSAYQCQTYQFDSYLLFLERAIGLLMAPRGRFGMIIPNPWLTNLLQGAVRKLVTGSVAVTEIVHFLFPVFRKVTVDTEIVLLRAGSHDGAQPLVSLVPSLASFRSQEDAPQVRKIKHSQRQWISLGGAPINIFLDQEARSLAEKCAGVGRRLEESCSINVGIKPYQTGKGKPPQTRKVVSERPFDSDHPLDETYRAYLRGADISRYCLQPVKPRFISYGAWLAEPRPAANFDAPVKILMRQTGDSLVAMLDRDQLLCLNNMHVVVPKSQSPVVMYILGVINSELLDWYYHTLNPEIGEALAEVKKANVASLPIRTIDFSDPADVARHDQMVALVERMLDLHQRLPQARTPADKHLLQRQIAATDREIDALVYELYGLTEQEIAVVEGER